MTLHRFDVEEPVRPVARTGQTGLSPGNKLQSYILSDKSPSKFSNALFKLMDDMMHEYQNHHPNATKENTINMMHEHPALISQPKPIL